MCGMFYWDLRVPPEFAWFISWWLTSCLILFMAFHICQWSSKSLPITPSSINVGWCSYSMLLTDSREFLSVFHQRVLFYAKSFTRIIWRCCGPYDVQHMKFSLCRFCSKTLSPFHFAREIVTVSYSKSKRDIWLWNVSVFIGSWLSVIWNSRRKTLHSPLVCLLLVCDSKVIGSICCQKSKQIDYISQFCHSGRMTNVFHYWSWVRSFSLEI